MNIYFIYEGFVIFDYIWIVLIVLRVVFVVLNEMDVSYVGLWCVGEWLVVDYMLCFVV